MEIKLKKSEVKRIHDLQQKLGFSLEDTIKTLIRDGLKKGENNVDKRNNTEP